MSKPILVRISISDFLNLPDLTQIQIIARVLKSVPNLKLEKISKIKSKSNQIQIWIILNMRKSDPNSIQIQYKSNPIHNQL